jgi:hypothetical protein
VNKKLVAFLVEEARQGDEAYAVRAEARANGYPSPDRARLTCGQFRERDARPHHRRGVARPPTFLLLRALARRVPVRGQEPRALAVRRPRPLVLELLLVMRGHSAVRAGWEADQERDVGRLQVVLHRSHRQNHAGTPRSPLTSPRPRRAVDAPLSPLPSSLGLQGNPRVSELPEPPPHGRRARVLCLYGAQPARFRRRAVHEGSRHRLGDRRHENRLHRHGCANALALIL